MGDSCCNPWSMGYIKKLLETNLPGVYVHSIMIGDSAVEDTKNGFFFPVNDQIDIVCKKIADDKNLRNGYNAIGFSQGSQFLRAVAQRCPQGMKKLLSFGGQHQGVYGLPKCLGENHLICDYVRRLLNYGAYTHWIQKMLVQAQYWHDPLDEQSYRENSLFLADINNDRATQNTSYSENLQKLEKLVLVKFANDTVVDPRGTEWFDYFAPGQGQEMLPMRESALYKEDRIGLKAMDVQGKLDLVEVEGDHLQIGEEKFVQDFIKKYLI